MNTKAETDRWKTTRLGRGGDGESRREEHNLPRIERKQLLPDTLCFSNDGERMNSRTIWAHTNRWKRIIENTSHQHLGCTSFDMERFK